MGQLVQDIVAKRSIITSRSNYIHTYTHPHTHTHIHTYIQIISSLRESKIEGGSPIWRPGARKPSPEFAPFDVSLFRNFRCFNFLVFRNSSAKVNCSLVVIKLENGRTSNPIARNTQLFQLYCICRRRVFVFFQLQQIIKNGRRI